MNQPARPAPTGHTVYTLSPAAEVVAMTTLDLSTETGRPDGPARTGLEPSSGRSSQVIVVEDLHPATTDIDECRHRRFPPHTAAAALS